MHIHFSRFVLWRDNDRPDFTREFSRDVFHCNFTREFTWDDSRVTFPKSLAAFYPGFHPPPRDLSRCDITRVHPGEICSAWKGYKIATSSSQAYICVRGGLRLFSDVFRENAALFDKWIEIHSNPPMLYTMALTWNALSIHIRLYSSFEFKNQMLC